MPFPVGEEHDESVDDVVIATRKRREKKMLIILIIGRKELKCYNDTTTMTINHKSPPSGIKMKFCDWNE